MAESKRQVATVFSFDKDVPIKKKDGGSYSGFRLAFTNEDNEFIKIEKHMNSLKYNPQLEKQLTALTKGDVVVINEAKNAAGFWEIVSITDADVAAATEGEVKITAPTPKKEYTPNSTGRDFETKEERKDKQLYIIRQSSLGHAVEISQSKSIVDVVNIAEQLTEWVMYGALPIAPVQDTKVKAPPKVVKGAIEDMEDDIPL